MYRFRLALIDAEALDTYSRVSSTLRGSRHGFVLSPSNIHATGRGPRFTRLRANSRRSIETSSSTPRMQPDELVCAGFLRGHLRCRGKLLTRGASDLEQGCRHHPAHRSRCRALDFPHVSNRRAPTGCETSASSAGLPSRQRFFAMTAPAITRKLYVARHGRQDGVGPPRHLASTPLATTIDMLDITTGTGDFIANGVISHNCFARGTHEYLDLDAGSDFDSQIVVKVNVAEVLREGAARGSWAARARRPRHEHRPVSARRGPLRLMPGIIEALAEIRHTVVDPHEGHADPARSSAARRRRQHPCRSSLAMSIAMFDDDLQHSIEPGTPTTHGAPRHRAGGDATRDSG